MIYIRNIFKQDLRDGKQIAFPTEASNIFFEFSFQKKDEDRNISFTFREDDVNNSNHEFNGTTITTRLYSAGSESRIDSELKGFLRDSLNAQIGDKVIFWKRTSSSYDFEFISHTSPKYSLVKHLLRSNNHEVLLIDTEEVQSIATRTIEGKKLNKVLFETFEFLIEKFGEDNIFKSIEYKDSKIDANTIRTIAFENHFNNDSIIAIADKELSKVDLTSSNILRYFDSNLGLNISPYSYFTTQWNSSDDAGRSLGDFNNFLKDISNGELKIIKEDELYKLKENKVHSAKSYQSRREGSGTNKIYFGAPGTGKSFTIEEKTKDLGSRARRVTFHPDYDYASFVGGYMPVTEKEKDAQGVEVNVIKYKFAPQIFSQIYSDAWLDIKRDYYLIIEEINRGNCAEIFGDIFQLLDRKTQYPISATKEMVAYLNIESNKRGFERHDGLGDGDTLSLPPNLHIWATMNTSDQSLYPMDSAFKRRWDWEYIPICYDDTYKDKLDEEGQPLKNKSYDFKININGTFYPWIKFIEEVNAIISANKSLGMDKCIGNYFIEPSKGGYIELTDFIHKVIFYLWDDVFKDEIESIFDDNETYESFFPIQTVGANKITNLFKSLNIDSLPANEVTN